MFIFGEGADAEVLIGSGDMMHRNLDRRVEALVRLTEERHIADLTSLMARGMSDDYQHFVLGPDGRWTREHLDAHGQPLPHIQDAMIDLHASRRRKARRR